MGAVAGAGSVRLRFAVPRLDADLGGGDDAAAGLAFRTAAVSVGLLLGWISIAAVCAGLALDVAPRHRLLLAGLTLAAAAANTVATVVPWRTWLAERRGRILLDLWSAGLIAFVALLVAAGGSSFALLLFLAVPFIAVVQRGRRRIVWLAVSAGTCTAVAALISLSAGATAMRLALLAAAVGVALALEQAIRREVAAHGRAAARAELERTLAQEASHRIKNDLQTVADLLLLGRPDGGDGRAFDDTAARIRSIATVHRLLTEAEDHIDAGALLRSIADGAPVGVVVVAPPVALDASTAKQLGLVANELITNAFQHGAPPIKVELVAGPQMRGSEMRGSQIRLRVEDGGNAAAGPAGLGLELVRRTVEQGLGGHFELGALPGGGACAEVVFPR